MLRNLFKMATQTAQETSKRLKQTGPLIGTHNGHFHADEALAVYLLRTLPAYASSPLVRTRDPELLSTCHTVVDVGGEYDATVNRYDHHQRTFTTTFPQHGTKLSSAGLVYMHFGRAIIAQRTGLPADSPEVSILFEKIYTEFVEALDAHDNGISAYDPADTANIKKRFNDNGINLGSLVGDLNSSYTLAPSDPAQAQADEDSRFLTASTFMGETFLRKLDFYHLSWLPARGVVSAAFNARKENVHSSGKIMVLQESGPWKDHLYSLESEAETPEDEKPLYVLYAEGPHEGAKWRIQAVSVTKDSFQSRKPLPEAWRGFRDEELSAKSGVDGGVFVHASGFIGGNKSFEGAKEMAVRALNL